MAEAPTRGVAGAGADGAGVAGGAPGPRRCRKPGAGRALRDLIEPLGAAPTAPTRADHLRAGGRPPAGSATRDRGGGGVGRVRGRRPGGLRSQVGGGAGRGGARLRAGAGGRPDADRAESGRRRGAARLGEKGFVAAEMETALLASTGAPLASLRVIVDAPAAEVSERWTSPRSFRPGPAPLARGRLAGGASSRLRPAGGPLRGWGPHLCAAVMTARDRLVAGSR